MQFILTEKPAAAKKIAEALSDGKPKKDTKNKVSYFSITRNGKEIIVASAVGHLYGLAEKKKGKWTYPVFNVEWKPSYEIDKGAAYSKKYLQTIKSLGKGADEYFLATDKDIEGELLGYNALRFGLKVKDAKRMEFSTLTKPDIEKAYENPKPHLDFPLIEAGETRHILDYYYGINLSRALTLAIKAAGMFKILSSGRVQGPSLKILVDREKQIEAFKSKPFWQIELTGKVAEGALLALHEKDKFWEEKEAVDIVNKIAGKNGKVAEVRRDLFNQSPPNPFDLTTLQTEAYRCLGISPKITLDVAQDLYTDGLISYPRTSSQQLPPAIGYKNILTELSKQPHYKELCSELLKKDLTPNNGKKTDPAHPAIYPTGVRPKVLLDRKGKIYDLVVKRFFATFSEPAVRETMTVVIQVEDENFNAKGTRTKEKGWHKFYNPYVKLSETELPNTKKDEDVKVEKVENIRKETQPPKRYTPASIIRELEKKNLGTKATRASIIETLYNREYVDGKSLQATDLGKHTVETLEKYIPKILDEELTRHFEIEMGQIQEKTKKGKEVLEEAKLLLTDLLKDFKSQEKEIGEGLMEANRATWEKANTVGPCPVCKEGTLMMKRGKYGKFIACSRYPDCKGTFKLPSTGLIKTTEKICEECSHPMIQIIKKRRGPQVICINVDCPSKAVESDVKEKPCEKCKEGTMVLKKSVYGSFLACNRFPKCRSIEKLS